jgi:1,4-alpha-glucan branching enzyme
LRRKNVPTDGTGLIQQDPWLEPYRQELVQRFQHYQAVRGEIDKRGGLLGLISQGHEYFGFTRGTLDGQDGVWYREWAPGAQGLWLVGDFNEWNRRACALTRDEFGVWSVFLPDALWGQRLVHGSKIKVHVKSELGELDRLPAYIRRVVQEPNSPLFVGQYWAPPAYQWQNRIPKLKTALRVYEAHVGMAGEEGRVHSFAEFTANTLPRIASLGYNAVQLMAVMEHPYYGSFGYHVSNFYAVSSRFGTPEELKALIDAAHGLGIRVIMDIIHSHSVKNFMEGLNRFDGTDFQYFHGGPRGQHVAWDSLCFDYRKFEVQRFLLSNVRYWLEEYHFDGFRFDGVTSMLYLDHGLGKKYTTYAEYFGPNVDWDAVTYLMLANEVAHCVRPDCITIAEDVSGLPGLGRPVAEGGLGFDYRLAMGIPDYWIKLVKEVPDENWQLSDIYHTLLNRRAHEKHIAYAESHDQALVGDKTLAFWLMDQDMYTAMDIFNPSLKVARGVALHKLIRLLTFSLGGEGYLNFMGNEFGHPEWIDFPREGNQWSFHYARRQWSLADNKLLRYQGLQAFDQALQMLDSKYGLLSDPFIEQLACHEDTKQLIYRRGPLVFVVNLHPTESYRDLRIPVPDAEDYQVILNSDDAAFSGHNRVAVNMRYPVQAVPMYFRNQSVQLYLPARTAQVLCPISRVRS